MAEERIYFDNAAATPVDRRVLAAMTPYFAGNFGNPSSLHRHGREAHVAVERARAQVAGLLGAKTSEVFFTSGGTESNNLAIGGSLGRSCREGAHVVTSAIEHPSVLEACRRLGAQAVDVAYLPVDEDGILDPEDLRRAITPRTRLISIMAANNVVGTLQPIAECGRIAHERGILFHVDATQAAGKMPLDVNAIRADLLSFSAHKIYGPKGIGALFVRDGTRLEPLLNGGGQEGGLRSGTENVPGIVGMGAAAQLCMECMAEEAVGAVGLRDRLIDGVLEQAPGAYLIGDRYRRLPGLVCFGFDGLEGQTMRLLLALDDAGISVSTGSACSASHRNDPSHVLTAMGFDALRARGSVRVSLGRFSTQAEVDRFIAVLTEEVQQLTPIAIRR
jgi:cysteine desulfurase